MIASVSWFQATKIENHQGKGTKQTNSKGKCVCGKGKK